MLSVLKAAIGVGASAPAPRPAHRESHLQQVDRLKAEVPPLEAAEQAAREVLEERQRELAEAREAHQSRVKEVERTREDFDDDPRDELADELVEAKQEAERAELYVARAQRRETAAATKHQAARDAVASARHAVAQKALSHAALVEAFSDLARRFVTAVAEIECVRVEADKRIREYQSLWRSHPVGPMPSVMMVLPDAIRAFVGRDTLFMSRAESFFSTIRPKG